MGSNHARNWFKHRPLSMFTAAVAVALSLEHKGTQLATEYRELKTKFLTFPWFGTTPRFTGLEYPSCPIMLALWLEQVSVHGCRNISRSWPTATCFSSWWRNSQLDHQQKQRWTSRTWSTKLHLDQSYLWPKSPLHGHSPSLHARPQASPL